MCWATGQGTVGGPPEAADVDAGRTSITSPVFDLSAAAEARVEYWRWFSNGAHEQNDRMWVQINNGSSGWVNAVAGKIAVTTFEGQKVLQKAPDETSFKRIRAFIGPTNWSNYSLEADVRAATRRPSICCNALMISSAMPSLKYSFSGSALMFWNGSTAMARSESVAAAVRCPSLPDPRRAASRSLWRSRARW